MLMFHRSIWSDWIFFLSASRICWQEQNICKFGYDFPNMTFFFRSCLPCGSCHGRVFWFHSLQMWLSGTLLQNHGWRTSMFFQSLWGGTGRGEGGQMQILTPSFMFTGNTPGDVKLQATSLNCCNVVCYIPITTNSCWSYWYYWVVNFKWWTYAW